MRRLLTIDEASRKLGISRRTLERLRKNPEFPKPVFLTSTICKYEDRDLDNYIDKMKGEK